MTPNRAKAILKSHSSFWAPTISRNMYGVLPFNENYELFCENVVCSRKIEIRIHNFFVALHIRKEGP